MQVNGKTTEILNKNTWYHRNAYRSGIHQHNNCLCIYCVYMATIQFHLTMHSLSNFLLFLIKAGCDSGKINKCSFIVWPRALSGCTLYIHCCTNTQLGITVYTVLCLIESHNWNSSMKVCNYQMKVNAKLWCQHSEKWISIAKDHIRQIRKSPRKNCNACEHHCGTLSRVYD